MTWKENPVKGQCASKATEWGCFHRKHAVSLEDHFPKDSAPPAEPQKERGVKGEAPPSSGAFAPTPRGGERGSRLPASIGHHPFLLKHFKCLHGWTVCFSKAGVPSCSGAMGGLRGMWEYPKLPGNWFVCNLVLREGPELLADSWGGCELQKFQDSFILAHVSKIRTQVPWVCAHVRVWVPALQKPLGDSTRANKISF